jgi:uncharacterized protein (TIGR03067 family)
MKFLPAALFVTLWAVPALAQSDPLVRPLPPAAAGTETLGKFLRDLGFEPKALSPDVLQVSMEKDRWPVHVMMSLSTDGRRIWLESKFAPIDDPDKVAPTAWKRLLEANENIGPAHFAFDKADKRVHLYKSFDNQSLTATRLRVELDQFDSIVRKTQDYWRGENFKPVIGSTDPPAPTPPIPPAVPTKIDVPVIPVSREIGDAEKLVGEWEVAEIHVKGRQTPREVLTDRKASVQIRPAGPGKLTADIHTGPDATRTVRVILDPDRPTKFVDFLDDHDRTEFGIYTLDGNTLTLCFAAPGDPRPIAFTTGEESRSWLIVLKRAK